MKLTSTIVLILFLTFCNAQEFYNSHYQKKGVKCVTNDYNEKTFYNKDGYITFQTSGDIFFKDSTFFFYNTNGNIKQKKLISHLVDYDTAFKVMDSTIYDYDIQNRMVTETKLNKESILVTNYSYNKNDLIDTISIYTNHTYNSPTANVVYSNKLQLNKQFYLIYENKLLIKKTEIYPKSFFTKELNYFQYFYDGKKRLIQEVENIVGRRIGKSVQDEKTKQITRKYIYKRNRLFREVYIINSNKKHHKKFYYNERGLLLRFISKSYSKEGLNYTFNIRYDYYK